MKHLLACVAILAAFNVHSQVWNANADVDQDGCVGVGDVLDILSVFGSCEPASACVSPTMDGYTYDVVEIGDQCWFAENLRTTVYRNGDVIPAGLTDEQWTSTTSGATAVYGENNSACWSGSPDIDACDEAQSLAQYGRLYNWHAVDDARRLCPTGWHVSTDAEWTDLTDFVSLMIIPSLDLVQALKSTYGWFDDINGTDDFGFSALPCGYRLPYEFTSAGINSFFWTSTLESSDEAFMRRLHYTGGNISRSDYSFGRGFSVRCVKDAE